jgi:hypothetical protein
MGKPDMLKKAEAALRALALTYPGTHEDHPWGESAFKVIRARCRCTPEEAKARAWGPPPLKTRCLMAPVW